jgi:uncharacterized spore protein YtfJ
MAHISTPGPASQANPLADASPAVNTIQTTLDKFLTAANVDAVYGPSISQGENVVIPAAEVLSIVGFGLGSGGGSQGISDSSNARGSGGGGGGGGRVLSRPVAAIIISPAGVRVEPIVDVTKIALAVFTTLGFMATVLTRMKNPRRRPKLDGD